MILEIKNSWYSQRLKDLDLISPLQRRMRGQLIVVFLRLNIFTTARGRGLSIITSMAVQGTMV